MWDTVFKTFTELAGAGLAVLFFGFILGIIYTQRRCAAVQAQCHIVRERNKNEIVGKINEVKGNAGLAIGHHAEACPNANAIGENAKQIATMRATNDTEIRNIHHRMNEIKASSDKTEQKVTDELRSQRRFLDDLATKLINGTRSKGG